MATLYQVASSEAATLRVPADYPTLLEGLDAAVSGDVVLVAPGTYTASDTRIYQFGGPVEVTANGFLKPGITVQSEAGRDQTIIDANEPSTGYRIGLFMMDASGPTVTIDGFTITAPVRGIEGNFAASLDIHNCRFTESGQAIRLQFCSLAMESSEVLDCGETDVSGRALISDWGSNIELSNCRFEGNADGAIGVDMTDANLFQAVDCVFIDNAGRTGGIGIGGWSGVSISIERNLFLRNSSQPGNQGSGGVRITGGGHGSIRFNVFAFDTTRAPGSGGGLSVAFFNGEIANNTFAYCHSDPPYPGAAVMAHSGAGGAVAFRNNIIFGSTGGVATYNAGGSTVILPDCNAFWENEGGNYEGGTSPWPQAATDFFADPLFCSPANLDFTLNTSSPCAPHSPQGCGLVGALNVACGIISVEQSSWGAIKALYR